MKKLLCFIMVVSLAIMVTLPVLADPLPIDEPPQKLLVNLYPQP